MFILTFCDILTNQILPLYQKRQRPHHSHNQPTQYLKPRRSTLITRRRRNRRRLVRRLLRLRLRRGRRLAHRPGGRGCRGGRLASPRWRRGSPDRGAVGCWRWHRGLRAGLGHGLAARRAVHGHDVHAAGVAGGAVGGLGGGRGGEGGQGEDAVWETHFFWSFGGFVNVES